MSYSTLSQNQCHHLDNTIHVGENREEKKKEMRETDRYETTEYVRKNWDMNQRNLNKNAKILESSNSKGVTCD